MLACGESKFFDKLPFEKLMLDYVEIIHIYIKTKFYVLFQGKERPAK